MIKKLLSFISKNCYYFCPDCEGSGEIRECCECYEGGLDHGPVCCGDFIFGWCNSCESRGTHFKWVGKMVQS